MNVTRREAATYAEWFRCVSDPSRIMILNLLAAADRPLAVGEIVSGVDVGQSTVSHHLAVLADAEFVLAERRGNASYYRINADCLESFPAAAAYVMGRLQRAGGSDPPRRAPWQTRRPRPQRS